jgi:hypothetical protein
MSIEFTKTTRNIEEYLRDIIEADFSGVYIADEYMEKGGEGIRIDAVSSASIEKTSSHEEREYSVEITHYFRSNDPLTRAKNTKNRVDRLVQLLNSNQVVSTRWHNLTIESIEYNIDEDSESTSATKLTLNIANFNSWS